MKLTNTLLFFIFLFPVLSYSQANYKAGYVVSLKGDTLRGYVNYKEWENNPASFSFKKALNQRDAEIFTVKSAAAVAITGQLYFQRFVLALSQDRVEMGGMNSRLDTSSKVDTVFFRLLVKGRYLNMYAYKDDLKLRFFLTEPAKRQPYELVYHAYTSFNAEESTTIQYVRRYRTQLENLLQRIGSNNEHLMREISQSDYSESDLTSIAQKINGNTARQFTTPNLFGLRFFAGAGVNNSSLKFTGEMELAGTPPSKSMAPVIDAGIDFFTNKNIQKFYLRAEFSFSYGQYSFSNTDPQSTPAGESNTLNVKQYNLAFTPQFVFNFYNGERFKAFVDAGIGINAARYNQYQFITTFDTFPSRVISGYPDLEKYYMTVPLKAGVCLSRKLEIYAGYVPTVSITGMAATAFRSGITSYRAGLNYLF